MFILHSEARNSKFPWKTGERPKLTEFFGHQLHLSILFFLNVAPVQNTLDLGSKDSGLNWDTLFLAMGAPIQTSLDLISKSIEWGHQSRCSVELRGSL